MNEKTPIMNIRIGTRRFAKVVMRQAVAVPVIFLVAWTASGSTQSQNIDPSANAANPTVVEAESVASKPLQSETNAVTLVTLPAGNYETSYEPRGGMLAFKGVLKVLPDGAATWYRHRISKRDMCAEKAVPVEIKPLADSVVIKFILGDLGNPACETYARRVFPDGTGNFTRKLDNGGIFFVRPMSQ